MDAAIQQDKKDLLKRMKERGIDTFRRIIAHFALGMFTWAYAREWTGISFVVHQEGKRLGRQLLKSWLLYHRIQHCARCLGINVQLRKTIITENEQRVYLCEKCFAEGEPIGAVKPDLEIIKP